VKALVPLLLAAWLLPGLAYVLPAERVLRQIEKQRSKQPPLRIEAELSGASLRWPSEVVFELHPEHGYRVSDDQGGRWLIRGGRVLAGTEEPTPAWIPELELLVLRAADDLRRWFRRAEVDLERNELARCGELDCFVLGGADARSQVWIDKESFDVLRWTSSSRSVEFLSYSDWDGQRFPAIVELRDRRDVFATLVVHAVSRAGRLDEGDFTQTWVHAAPASPQQ
jgi:hypothetical protein